MRSEERWGVLAAAASSLLGGSSVAVTRAVIGEMSPASLGLFRFGIGALCLLPLFLAARQRGPGRRDLVAIVLLGLLFFAVFPWLFNASLSRTTAARGALALSTLPLFTLLLGALFRHEAPSRRKAAGVAIAVAGVAVALTGKASASAPQAAWIGDLLMIATALCGALFNVLSRPYLARMPAMIFTFPAMLAGATGLATIAVLDGSLAVLPALAASGWAAILFLGIFGAALTFWLWNYGLEHTTPTRVAITVTLNPIVAMALAVPLLGEPVTARLLLGLVGVIAGIALTAWQGPAEARAPARP